MPSSSHLQLCDAGAGSSLAWRDSACQPWLPAGVWESPGDSLCGCVQVQAHAHTDMRAHSLGHVHTQTTHTCEKPWAGFMGGGYRPTGSRAVCLGARGQDRRGVLGRTAGPSVRGDGGRGRPLVAPLDSVSFIGVSETFSDQGTRRPPLWLALSRVCSGPALPRAAWHALAGRLGCPGGAWSMPPAESLDGHHGPATGPAGSSLRVLGGGGDLGGRAGRVRSGG